MNAAPFITRFAPSPTGRLHLGHAYSAYIAHDAARAAGGRFILRIEDIDLNRCKPEYEAGILEDLAWLGLHWDGLVRRQSDHLNDYVRTLTNLTDLGLTYPCFCTRRQIEAAVEYSLDALNGPEGPIYPGTCRDLSDEERTTRARSGEPFAVRLNTAKALAHAGDAALCFIDETLGEITADPLSLGDVVLARKDTPSSYHLSVTVDDALQDITHIIRGMDLLPMTHVHRLLQAVLDLPTPRYHHHDLITGEDGKPFAKRNKSLTLQSLRDAGETPGSIRARLGL